MDSEMHLIFFPLADLSRKSAKAHHRLNLRFRAISGGFGAYFGEI